MLVLNPSRLIRARGIREPYTFLREAGLPAGAARKILHGEYARPPLEHLERLCILLQCTPNDLLRWTPGEGQSPQLPLAALAREDEDLAFLEQLRDLPLPALRALGKELGRKLQDGGA
jgi:DNA-binding Xre family transcriptional regulator